MKNLVIVESPAKAKTISKFLNNDYVVLASMGHIRDLPKDKLGFDPNNNFEASYVINNDKRKVISELKSYITPDTVIYLASDEDREGEAISWHLVKTLKLDNHNKHRIVFHEITKNAILHAIENPRDIDQNLVDAQQARRILDRAVGYELSPLLWKKVRFGLSAGRVQSVALRIIVDRENEINTFIPEEFWKIKVDFINPSLVSELVKYNNKKLEIKTKQEADNVLDSLENGKFLLENIEEKDSVRNPAPPFTTSTLQQEASRKLSMSIKTTMLVAQQLYEGHTDKNIPNHTGGLITYMRTDSLNLSDVATTMAKEVINSEYGSEYSLTSPRVFKSKAKGAQEAHEAIRPVNLSIKPSDIKPYVNNDQYRLYSLIWKRTLATQMKEAKVSNTIYSIKAGKDGEYTLESRGTRIVFPGFMKAYTEGSDNPESVLDNAEKILPNIIQGTYLNKDKITSEQKFTLPPARYTEASLVKKLEGEGIGRPSTYVPTITNILNKKYIEISDKKIYPTDTGKMIITFLMKHFPNIIDLKFTSIIEEEFDIIADGKKKWEDVMRDFYVPFKTSIDSKADVEKEQIVRKERILGKHENKDVIVRTSKYGPLAQIGTRENKDNVRYANIPKKYNIDTITLEEVLRLFVLPRNIGKNKNGEDVIVNIGKFGPYYKIGPKFFKLDKDFDPYEVTIEELKI